MNENIKYGILFILVGVIGLFLGITWKKPNYESGKVRKYLSIAGGILAIIFGIIRLLQVLL